MKRTASTAMTRGKITRVIVRTIAIVRCYEKTSGELVDLEVRFDCKVARERVIAKAIKGGYISTGDYTVLEVVSTENTGALYAMDVETFIEHAEVIEDGLTDNDN